MRKFLSSGRKNKVMKNRRKRIRELEAQPGGCHFITDLLKVKDWRSWGGNQQRITSSRLPGAATAGHNSPE